jgi:CubicO group peptidase (beta-lactamase class C family)
MMTRRTCLGLLTIVPVRAASRLDDVFEYVKTTTKHGGLAVQQDGRLVYERYFGRAHRDATPNLASVGKSFTSIAAGILMHEHRKLFSKGLDMRVYDGSFLAHSPTDERKRDIRLGHLLTMTSGLRGNSPGAVNGRPVPVDPPGPDGWQAMTDDAATNTALWCDPGAGYSYATAGVHLVSMMVRHVSGLELEEYLRQRVAKPLEWKQWGFGYKRPEITHTPGGGGIQLRSADILRFGEMMLRGGKWNGKQIVPVDYVRMCARSSPFNPHSPYSLQFDVNGTGQARAPRDAYWKTGSGGHAIYVVPSMKLVIWKLGGRDEQYNPSDTDDGSRAGFRTSVPPNEAARRTLEMTVAALIGEK